MNSYEKTELIQYFVSESQRKQNTIDDLMEQIHQKNKTIEEYQNQNKELVKWIKVQQQKYYYGKKIKDAEKEKVLAEIFATERTDN